MIAKAVNTALESSQPANARFHLEIATNKPAAANGEPPTFHVGEKMDFIVRADRNCYLTLIDVGTSGTVTPSLPAR